MTANEIVKILENEITRKGYEFRERESASTSSRYFVIRSGPTSLLFRVADHPTKKNVITLRTDHRVTKENVVNFARNRCEDVSRRRVKEVLGI